VSVFYRDDACACCCHVTCFTLLVSWCLSPDVFVIEMNFFVPERVSVVVLIQAVIKCAAMCVGQRIQRQTQSYKVLWIISLFSAIHTADKRRSIVTCDFLRIIRCLFKALTSFRGCSCPHPVLSSIRGKSLQWEVRRCWRLQLILNYTMHILSVCLYPYLSSMQSERILLYCHLWSVRIYHIFPHYLKKSTIFGKR
jgi:hypothetical protein